MTDYLTNDCIVSILSYIDGNEQYDIINHKNNADLKKITMKINYPEYGTYYNFVNSLVFKKIYHMKMDPSASFQENIDMLYEMSIYFPYMIHALGGIKKAFELPVLDLKEKSGSTGYIDFIESNEMSAPIMRGIDCYGRPFVTFRYKLLSQKQYDELKSDSDLMSDIDGDNADNKDNVDGLYVETFFQRYSSNLKKWTTGGDNEISLWKCVTDNKNTCKKIFNRVERLVNGEIIEKFQFKFNYKRMNPNYDSDDDDNETYYIQLC